ncbi:ATP-binding protein [Deinococcus sp. YIM 134068]|uniref:sensor histidine kinase n=1 Tax=Deinococcus lichenicola TaxID=3118910 RepID=UPI002F944A0E
MTHDDLSPALPPEAPASELPARVRALEVQVRDLEAREQRARALFDAVPVASLVLDAEGRIEEVNAAGAALLGLPPGEVRGRRLGEFAVPGSRPVLDRLLGRVFEAPVVRWGEVRLRHADGPPREVRLDAVAPGGGGEGEGQARRCHLTATDLAPSGPGRQAVDLEHTARVQAQGEELEQVVGAFIGQLQGPVGRAMSALRLLRRVLGDAPPGVARPLLHAERSTQQVLALLESVDRYMQVRHMGARLRRVDLNAVLREVLKELHGLLADRRVQLTGGPLPTVEGDSQALSVILTEYVSNALKFTRTRDEARLHFHVRETDTEYHVGLEDNGVGFDPNGGERLFRLFGRQHPSSAYEGSGLGLAVVRRVCERFGGRVWGEGRPGEGATFWFAWPRQPTLPTLPTQTD